MAVLKEAENKTCDLRAVFTNRWWSCVLSLFHIFVAVGNVLTRSSKPTMP